MLSRLYTTLLHQKLFIKSLLQFEAFDQNVFDPSQALQFASPGSSLTDISNMVELYESRTNYLKVIEDLKLNIKIYDLHDEESVNIDITSDKNDPVISNMLKFSFSELDYALLDEDSNEILTARYGEKIRFNDLDISIQSASLKEYRPLEIVLETLKACIILSKQK